MPRARASAGRLGLALVLLLAAAGLLLAAAPHARLGRAALLTADLLLQSRASPLQWLTAAPEQQAATFTADGAAAAAVLYRPAGQDRPRPAVILSAGFAPDLSDPLLNRLAADLARLNFVVLIPSTPALRTGILAPSDVAVLVSAHRWLTARRDLVSEPVGFGGFCVGSSLAFLAAADERIASQVGYVHAFGGYCDARVELRAIRTGQPADQAGVTWRAAPRAAELLVQNLLIHLDSAADRPAILAALADHAQEPPPGLTPLDALLAQLLLTGDPAEFDRLLAQLPAEQQRYLDAVSPCAVAQRIQAPTLIMHDLADPYVPPSEAERLAARLPAATPKAVHFFTIFDHVQPSRIGDLTALARESIQLMRHLDGLLLLMEGPSGD